ncbi:MAG: efflux RND transporter permease subunit, partial [Desulfomonilaceae bacterium]
MNYDIFPALDIPTIYVIEAYPGMLPDQMESFLTYWFEQRFTYVGGVKHVESRSLLNCALMKVEFQQGTDMGVAMGETVAECTRAVANMPAGTRPPLIMRYDAGGVPVGDLVFSSRTASVAELQDMALNIVRPFFATLPGISAPPPFGGAPRAIVVNLKPDRLAQYNISPEDVVIATANANMVTPAGLVPIWNRYPMVRLNSEIQNIEELLSVPIRTGVYPTVFLRDIATVEDSHDIVTCYALVNGRRTVYLPVTKRAAASTLAVVNTVKKNVPMFQKFLPEGINVSYEFDQSPYVTRAINNLAMAGALGAVLAGLVILIFLRDWFSPFIVMINILLGVMSAALALWLAGQTINIMTLVGLALAVVILVNESTVCIENLHVHLEAGEPLALAALNSTSETLGPRLLAVICSLAMFSPTAFMSGASRSLFFPLSLAAGFSLIASYLLSSALVPVLSIWMLRGHQKSTKNDKPAKNRFETFKKWYTNFVFRVIKLRWWALGGYLAVSAIIIVFVGGSLSTEIYPTVNSGRLQIRLVAPAGTQLDDTEALT